MVTGENILSISIALEGVSELQVKLCDTGLGKQ